MLAAERGPEFRTSHDYVQETQQSRPGKIIPSARDPNTPPSLPQAVEDYGGGEWRTRE